jgi:hypothetical protein
MSVAPDLIPPTIETVSVSGPLDKHLFESVANSNRIRPTKGLNVCSIEGMFGTQVRIRCSRPRPDAQPDHWTHRDARRDHEEHQMSALTAAPGIRTAPMSAASLSAAPLPRLRLTKRGRAVFTTLASLPLVLAAVVLVLSGGDARASLDSGGTTFSYVTVGAGESLWSIAETLAPDADPREVIADIVSLNQLPSADVEVGEQLAIPTEYSAR